MVCLPSRRVSFYKGKRRKRDRSELDIRKSLRGFLNTGGEFVEGIPMKASRFFQIVVGVTVVTATLIGAVANAAMPNNDDHTDKVIAAFLTHVDSLDSLSAARKSEIKTKVERLGKDQASDAITEGLIELHASYSQAVDSSEAENVDQAIELLAPLSESDDKFLAADASFYLARTLMNNERFEEALPHLADLTGGLGKYSVHQGNAQYFIAVAQAGLLRNQEAVESFMEFLQFNPSASERLRVSAWRQVQQLQSIQQGKLDDVYQRMDYSRRRLELIETDQATQQQQDKIVNILNQLIKQEEKKECSSNCKQGGT